MWYENFEFVEDPYSVSDPYSYPSTEFFEWNRDDLNRSQLDLFMTRVLEGRRTGIKVYGPSGSGKTWLARIVEKELNTKQEKGQVIYTRLTSLDPTFSSIYDDFLEGIMGDTLTGVFETLRSSGKHTLPEWKTVISDENLAACLWHLAYDPEKKDYCQMWLRGEKLSAGYLDEIKVTASLDRDTKKFKTMKGLIGLLTSAYPFVTLVVDELENARPVYAKALSDVLRELIDSFYHKFALLCSYTAERADDWFDLGYTDFLYRRLELLFSLDSVAINYGPDWLRKLHETYRRETFSGDQLAPFTEAGIQRLLELMEPTRRYPGYILSNCTTLAEQAAKDNTLVDESLLNRCAGAGLLTGLSSQTTFM
jgi:hypothetical protein